MEIVLIILVTHALRLALSVLQIQFVLNVRQDINHMVLHVLMVVQMDFIMKAEIVPLAIHHVKHVQEQPTTIVYYAQQMFIFLMVNV